MFKGLGQLASLFQNLPRIQAEFDGLQQRLGQLVAEGDAGGGMVKVRVNGKLEVPPTLLPKEGARREPAELLSLSRR